MTKSLLQFANESFLFQKKSIQTRYSRYRDYQVERELAKYRQFSLKNAENKPIDKQNLDVLVEGTYHLPDEDFLKQISLYVNKVIINDPLFGFTLPKNDYSEAMGHYLGLEHPGLDRGGIAEAAKYIIHHHKAIHANLVDFLPLSYLHEPPPVIPITYSDILFSDVLPTELLRFFRESAKVVPLIRRNGALYIDKNAKLTPCNGIDISFSEETHRSFPYLLLDMKVVSSNEETGEVEFFQSIPNSPPEEQFFRQWVSQSINQASRHFFDEIYKEISLSNNIGSSYLSRSNFVYRLLKQSLPLSSDFKTDILNLEMNLDLPFLENLSLDKLIDIRMQDGASFENFRIELEKQLRELRTIKESSELRIRLENVAHELGEIQIREIDKKILTIKRKMIPDAFILVGGLATIIQANGWGIPAVLYAIQNGYKTYQEYILGVKEKPAFFLWKLKTAK